MKPESTYLNGVVLSTKVVLKDASNGKFKRDTVIARIKGEISRMIDGSEVTRRGTETIFLTVTQQNKYGLDNVLYRGNYLAIECEETIEGKTTYTTTDSLGNKTEQYHPFTGLVFKSAEELDMDSVKCLLSSMGMSDTLVKDSKEDLQLIRATHEVKQPMTNSGMEVSSDFDTVPFEEESIDEAPADEITLNPAKAAKPAKG